MLRIFDMNHYWGGEARRFALLLSRYVRYFSFRFTLGVMGMMLVVLAGARWLHVEVGPDPFVAYQSIMPGASSETLPAFNCRTVPSPLMNGMPVEPSSKHCDITLKDNLLFHLISIEFRDERVEEVTFYSMGLEVDDLMQRWGDPQGVLRANNHEAYTLSWDRGDYIASAVVSRPPSSTVVGLITFKVK